MPQNARRRAWKKWVCVLAGIVLIAGILFYSIVPKFPQPMYEVDSYEALVQELRGNENIVVPSLEGLPLVDVSCTVVLKSRTGYAKAGYLLSGRTDGEQRRTLWMDVHILEENDRPLNQDMLAHGLWAEVDRGDGYCTIKFDWNGTRYLLESNDLDAISEDELLNLMKQIIEPTEM